MAPPGREIRAEAASRLGRSASGFGSGSQTAPGRDWAAFRWGIPLPGLPPLRSQVHTPCAPLRPPCTRGRGGGSRGCRGRSELRSRWMKLWLSFKKKRGFRRNRASTSRSQAAGGGSPAPGLQARPLLGPQFPPPRRWPGASRPAPLPLLTRRRQRPRRRPVIAQQVEERFRKRRAPRPRLSRTRSLLAPSLSLSLRCGACLARGKRFSNNPSPGAGTPSPRLPPMTVFLELGWGCPFSL